MSRVVAGSVLVVLGFALAVGGFLFLQGTGSLVADGVSLTGLASDGLLSLCINEPPVVNLSSCPAVFNQSTAILDNTVSCFINASDADDDSLNRSVDPDFANWTWVNASGFLFLRPFQDEVGAHAMEVYVADDSGCSNGLVSVPYSFEVLDVNDPPLLYRNITDVSFSQGSSLSPWSLYDFFMDPDGDALNFSVFGASFVSVTITQSTGSVYFSATGCGTEYLLFQAEDPFNLTADSNVVTVRVTCTPTPQPPGTSGTGSGGGGGSFSPCTPRWKCYPWSDCSPNGTRYKECIDLNGCNANDYERTFWDECVYVPTCYDGIQNQGETGVDCGGPCPPCGTCFDGIQNNDEEGVDCGGSYCEPCHNCSDGIMNWGETGVDCGGPFCPPCVSCFDGIQNQGETGIDCGGPCPPCLIMESPGLITQRSPLSIIVILLVVGALCLLVLFRFYHRQIVSALVRLGLYVTRQHHKQFLLSDDEKSLLLRRIELLKVQVRLMERPVSFLVEEVASLSRLFFHYAVDLPLTFSRVDLVPVLDKLVSQGSLRSLLLSFFGVVRDFEQVGVDRSYVDVDLVLEELRVLAFMTSDARPEDMVHEAAEKEVAGSWFERFQAGFYNVLLALQFEELEAAKKHYLVLVSLYEGLGERQKGVVYERLSRAYHAIKCVASWVRL